MSGKKLLLRWRIINQALLFWSMMIFVRPFMVMRFNLKFNISRDVRKIVRKGCIIIPNHTISWDPVMVNAAFFTGVHWVATEALFRKKFMNFFMTNIAASIPKTKNRSDMEMLNLLQGYVKLNRPVGIFAEGQQTWDGKGLSAMAGTDKLIRFLKVPVVFVRSEGGFLTKPRWTKGTRRNQISYNYSIGIGPEEVKGMKLAEIQERLAGFLDYNEYQLQKNRMIPLKSERRAEHMELTLFTCPHCLQLGTLSSRGNWLSCSHCDYNVEVDKYGFFVKENQDPFFYTPVEWNEWQQQVLPDFIKQNPAEKELTVDEEVILWTSHKRRPLVKTDSGQARLYRDRIEFSGSKEEKRVFPLKDVTGFNVFKQQNVEFYYHQTLYRMQLTHPSGSSLKWLSLVDQLNLLEI